MSKVREGSVDRSPDTKLAEPVPAHIGFGSAVSSVSNPRLASTQKKNGDLVVPAKQALALKACECQNVVIQSASHWVWLPPRLTL